MNDEGHWAEWFASYREFVLHYAEIAEQAGAVGLSVGTELRQTVHREAQWRETISLTRARFGGWLTYAANWDDFDQVPWWDAVDYIGVQAYFELGDAPTDLSTQRQQLTDAWIPIRDRLHAVSGRFDRKIFFTEVGYKSHEGATVKPWRWELEGESDPVLQAHAYEAAFRSFWHQPWFAGFYWWKWHPAAGLRSDRSRDFTPQGKPAESVLRHWYHRTPWRGVAR